MKTKRGGLTLIKKKQFCETICIRADKKRSFRIKKKAQKKFEVDEDWGSQNSLKAEREIEYGRVFHEPTRLESGSTELGRIMGGSRRGMPQDHVKYSYRKGGNR